MSHRAAGHGGARFSSIDLRYRKRRIGRGETRLRPLRRCTTVRIHRGEALLAENRFQIMGYNFIRVLPNENRTTRTVLIKLFDQSKWLYAVPTILQSVCFPASCELRIILFEMVVI